MTTLQMSQDVQERLKKHLLNDSDQLVLDFDDGVGAYSKVGVCSLDVSFRFLIVNKQGIDAVYDQTIASPLGDVRIKGYADNYVDEAPELYLNKFGLITLKTAAGIIDTNVEILDHPEAMTEMAK
ncbi:iron-sulfur cluster biosynthesis family protein [Secundilactobacillus mixtipabuli]|uniref:Core domain-containing protein n=1 Tax=Secundilactobacillus mixtipabuli TaxID=1435342 RepID=A0A1Z5IB98_9LACO|nr:iron-sulfur cluster biosynthesis family protein [Secundilactobacillus mixtipabuli]GAW98800.1 hypothetical protein IWT30_00759 [Secundilactobacillus mixtipabuli]